MFRLQRRAVGYTNNDKILNRLALRSTTSNHAAHVTTFSSRRVGLYGVSAVAGGLLVNHLYGHWYTKENHRLDSKDSWNQGSSSHYNTKLFNSQTPQREEQGRIVSEWSAIGDKVKNVVIPAWASVVPGFIAKFQKELQMEPGTLAHEMWEEANDANVHPEVGRDAFVRVSDDLCDEEQQYLRNRKHFTRKALGKYLGISEDDIHPDDIPTIAMCGSGGGLRALVAGCASYLSAQEAGLFDCITYTAGVSGSCWLQTLFHSTLTDHDFGKLINHLKARLDVHIAFPPPVMQLLTSAPTHKYLLSGAYEKFRTAEELTEFGLVDVYGTLLGARLLVPKGDLTVNDKDLKLSNQREYIDDGTHPLPIYTAVRHEIPAEEVLDNGESDRAIKSEAKKEAWFQWFEFTPYEFWLDEVSAGIPMWSVGRHFKQGHSLSREDKQPLPELRIPLLMGVWGSAFCATLSHYYNELRPLLKGLTGFKDLDSMIRNRNEDLAKVHPIDPTRIPNFVYGMRDKLPERCPESLHTNSQIQLMDAGMSNNLPIYPLLRQGRNVDVLIAFDASADIKQDNWLRVADGYAKQRGIKGWPIGTGWPAGQEIDAKETGKALDDAEAASTSDAKMKTSQAAKDQKMERADRQGKASVNASPEPKEESVNDLGPCTVWVGTTEERIADHEPPQSKRVEEDWELLKPDAGIAVVYFPFLANAKVEGVDPATSNFMSTWNFIYTPEEIDKVVSLARANFQDGAEKTKMTIRAVYERKKNQRLERQERDREHREKWVIGG